jgi:hypothetical protein
MINDLYNNKLISIISLLIHLFAFSFQSSRPSSERSDRPAVLTLADLSPTISDNNNELPNERLNSSYHLQSIPLVRSSSSLSDSNRRSQHSNHSGREVIPCSSAFPCIFLVSYLYQKLLNCSS